MLKMITVGPFATNCYLLTEENGETLVIDPGEAEVILDLINRHHFHLKYIINTHGHIDHTLGNESLREHTGAPVLIHSQDAPLLANSENNLSSWLGITSSYSADKLLSEGNKIVLKGITMQVIHTPGHTPGSICLFSGEMLFSGDTLFDGSIGRTDLPGGDAEQLISSIKNKLIILPENTVIYPGHGGVSTIGKEKRTNPFLI